MQKHFFTLIIIILNLCCGLQKICFANKVTLTKIGGNNTLYTSGITLAPNYVFNGTTTIYYNDPNDTIANWTDIFHTVADIINADPENESTSVSYAIDIDAPSASSPMWVCRQDTSLTTAFAEGTNILFFKGDLQTSLPINQITISTTNAKAYIKYVDSLYYGSWLGKNDTLQYYTLNCTNSSNPSTLYKTTQNDPQYWSSCISPVFTNINYINNTGFSQSIDSIGNQNAEWRNFNSSNCRAEIGYFIQAQNCNHLKIEKMDVNGNSVHCRIGGIWGDVGKQLQYSGIYLYKCKNGIIKNCNLTYFGQDGITIKGKMTDSIMVDSCICNYNGRAGIAWLGGKNIQVSHSEFNHSSKAFNTLSQAYVVSNPAAGMDIEPEDGCTSNNSNCNDTTGCVQCSNGFFNHCHFEDNLSFAVVNDGCLGQASLTDHVVFDSCTFYDTDSYGLRVRGNYFNFNHCHVYCSVKETSYGIVTGSETKFIHCDFEDKPYLGQHWTINNPLVEILDGRRTLFDDCIFKVNDSTRQIINILPSSSIPKDKWTIIKDCRFTYNNNGIASGVNISRLHGVRFQGQNKVENTLNGLNSYHLFETNHVLMEGNTTACAPSILEFEGQIEHYLHNDTFSIGTRIDNTEGYAQLKYKNKALSLVDLQTTVDINSLSALELESGASMYIGHDYLVKGQFIAHAGSYINLDSGHFIGSSSYPNALLYMDKNCNPNNATTSPLWSNGIGYGTGTVFPNYNANWLNTPSNICVQGGNAIATANACTPPVYTNVQTGNAITLLYNKTVACFGASGSSLDFKAVGGSGTYQYKLDANSYSTTTSYSGLSIGNHTLIVDDYVCKDTFVVSLDTAFTYTIIKGCVGSTAAQFSTNACTTPTVTGPSTATFVGNVASVTAAGTYTITATSSTGTATTTLYIGDCSHCTVADTNAQWYAPNSSTSDIFANGVAPSTPIVFEGNVDVDNNLYVYNNPKIFMTHNSEWVLNTNRSLVINKSEMKGCGEYWYGILADGAGKTVIVNNYSKLSDMSEGVQIMNNAFLQARNSRYKNNLRQGILFENANNSSYPNIVKNNYFESDNGFVPISGITQSLAGVRIINSSFIHLGEPDNAESGNTYDHLSTGVAISGTAYLASVLGNSPSRIGIYNSVFTEIHDNSVTGSYPVSQKVNNCYTSARGAGVSSNYTNAPVSIITDITVSNTNGNQTDLKFENCDKAVRTIKTNLKATNLYIKDNLMGVMNSSTDGLEYTIDNNVIENAIIGVQCIGNNGTSSIGKNIVKAKGNYAIGEHEYLWAKGIDLQPFTNITTNNSMVDSNEVEVADFAGVGINLQNTGTNILLYKNKVDLTCTDTTMLSIVCNGATVLNGIAMSNAYETKLEGNYVNGNSTIVDENREDEAGIFISNSIGSTLHCNHVQNTRFGVMAISECKTDSLNGITGNTLYNHVLGWAFRHLGTEGTFGQVGNDTVDNNNSFLGSIYSKKVFKFCDANDGYQIFTSLSNLLSGESGSYNINTGLSNDCKYGVQQNFGNITTFTCPTILNILPTINNEYIQLDEAILIATHTKQYTEYEEIARWLDEKRLYKQLTEDEEFRNSNEALLDFYTTMESDAIRQIIIADARLQALIASIQSHNPNSFGEQIGEADEANEGIDNSEIQNENEQTINRLYIKWLEIGMDSITEDDKDIIHGLALQCPYNSGTAVYKARSLWANYEPAFMYDDIKLCNNVGVNKANNNSSTKGLFDDENKYLSNLKASAENKIVLENELIIFPNPSNSQINIRYKESRNTKLQIVNVVGIILKEISLPKDIQQVSTLVNELNTGIYIYRQVYGKEILHTGKLIIE